MFIETCILQTTWAGAQKVTPSPSLRGQTEVGQDASVCSLGLPQGGEGDVNPPTPQKRKSREKKKKNPERKQERSCSAEVTLVKG